MTDGTLSSVFAWAWPVALLSAATRPRADAASFNQADDFEDGNTMTWAGHPFGTVSNLPSGGPAGAGDRVLETRIDGFQLGTKNTTQWASDYPAAAPMR